MEEEFQFIIGFNDFNTLEISITGVMVDNTLKPISNQNEDKSLIKDIENVKKEIIKEDKNRVIERIVKHKFMDSKPFYLIHWRDYPRSYTWKGSEEIEDWIMIKQYWERLGMKLKKGGE